MINFVEEFKKEKMSTGRRLAKRSIIGTKVCAPGPDGLWYSGVIQDVKASPTSTITSGAAAALADSADTPNADTKYIVRFDFKTQQSSEQQQTNKSVIMDTRRFIANVHISPAQTLRRNAMIKEFRETDLIGPGFRSINGIQLQPGQRVYLTYNGRETSGDVIQHDIENDEVSVKIIVIGTEEPIELKKRLEEVRLLESRRSARLADQDRDTDFARLADMGGDRRKTSHSIEVPYSMTLPHNSRKRPTSYTHDCSGNQCNEDEMNECHAAMILMKLHNSPKSPTNGEKWLGSSPGSSSASWSSGSSSPPLSDDGQIIGGVLNDANLRIRTTSVSTSDEGIVVDFTEDVPRKKKANRSRFRCTWKRCNHYENTASKIEIHIREQHLGKKKPKRSQDQDGLLSESDHEEEFYYTEEDDNDDDVNKTPSPTSPPTLSHRDMARPPHEDPEYQRQIVGNFKQGRNCQQKQQQNNLGRLVGNTVNHQISNSQQLQQLESNNTSCTPTSPLAHHNYTWPSNAAVATTSTPVTLHQSQSQTHNQVTYIKHARSSPRPSHSTAPYPSPTYVLQQHHNYSSSPTSSCSSSSTGSIHSSPNSSASNVLQQLTTHQNITVTTHHTNSNNNNQQTLQQQQHHPQMSTVTITPNFHHPSSQQQQHSRGNLQHCNIGTASNIVSTTTSNIHHPQHPQHTVVQQVVAGTKQAPNSPHRRTRGENKKCRKVYGMERRDLWCTQCKWKKACSRFGD